MATETPQQVVLLGASNLTRCFPLIVNTMTKTWEEPLTILVAMGNGRSFGHWSRFLYARELPGIDRCGLWKAFEALEVVEEKPPLALITDVGNDVMYGIEPAKIAEWVESCIKRLVARNAQIVMTLPPVVAVEKLKQWKYSVIKKAFFPGRKLTFQEMKSRTIALTDHLKLLGEQYKIPVVRPQEEWYTWDPIHIIPKMRQTALNTFFSHWPTYSELTDEKKTKPPRGFKNLLPEERRMFGKVQNKPQPIVKTEEVSISVY